jgi:hypothetical protein
VCSARHSAISACINDIMASQADLGIGKAPVATPTERRFVSAPNANPDFGVTLIEASLGTATKKRKMTSELTPDNADKVLTSSLDFSKFHMAVCKTAEMTEGEMFALLKSCVIDPSVGDLHLAVLSCCLTFYYCFNGRSSHFQMFERDMSNRLALTSLMTWTYSNQMWRRRMPLTRLRTRTCSKVQWVTFGSTST